jgi:hypothetical protein
MPFKTEYLLSSFDVPKLGSMVHGSRSYQHAVGVEGKTHYLHLVALQGMVPLPCIGIPNLSRPIKGPRNNLVPT